MIKIELHDEQRAKIEELFLKDLVGDPSGSKQRGRLIIVTTVEKRPTERDRKKERRGEFFVKSVSAKPRTFQWG